MNTKFILGMIGTVLLGIILPFIFFGTTLEHKLILGMIATIIVGIESIVLIFYGIYGD